MTTLTVHLEESLLRRTQAIAEARHITVDEVVATALKEVPQAEATQHAVEESYEERRERYSRILAKYSGFNTGGPFTREEMNER